MHYWVGCEAGEHEKCDDSNFNGLPEPIEYRSKTLTTPEIRAGGLNVFNGLIDDSMLVHRDKVAFYVTGLDGQGNVIAMGGGPVCDIHSSQYCGDLEPWMPGLDYPHDSLSYVYRSLGSTKKPTPTYQARLLKKRKEASATQLRQHREQFAQAKKAEIQTSSLFSSHYPPIE